MNLLNRFVCRPGIGVVILTLYAISLVLMEWLHTLGMSTDFYLMMVQVWYTPIVWLIDNDCCPYLEELLKWAASARKSSWNGETASGPRGMKKVRNWHSVVEVRPN